LRPPTLQRNGKKNMNMSEEQLQELAESGDWKGRAINLLQRKTKACLEIILSFVNDYWQNLASDEENLYNFEVYESEYLEVYTY
jgi:hypothetical protein